MAKRKSRPELKELKTAASSTQCWLCGMGLGDASSNRHYSGMCMSCWHDCQEDDITLGVFGGGGSMNHTRFMELALCRAIPDLTLGTLKHSRLGNLYKRLQKEVDRDLARLPRPSRADLLLIGKRITRFGLATGWLNEQRHVGTLLSFCAEMLENSSYPHNPKILETISLIIEHLENGGDLKTACCWAGSVAADKWQEVTG